MNWNRIWLSGCAMLSKSRCALLFMLTRHGAGILQLHHPLISMSQLIVLLLMRLLLMRLQLILRLILHRSIVKGPLCKYTENKKTSASKRGLARFLENKVHAI